MNGHWSLDLYLEKEQKATNIFHVPQYSKQTLTGNKVMVTSSKLNKASSRKQSVNHLANYEPYRGNTHGLFKWSRTE